MINEIKIRNFKNILNEDIKLERLTVFVGPNGSGKTSVLEAIHNAVRSGASDPKKVFAHERHCDWVYTRGGTGDLVLECITSQGSYEIRAERPADFPPDTDELLGKGRWQFHQAPDIHGERMSALGNATSLVFLHLSAPELAKKSYSDRDPPRVEFNGKGLASVLAYMKLIDDDAFDELTAHMKKFIPHFKRLKVRKAEVTVVETENVRIGEDVVKRRKPQRYQGEKILFDFDDANDVSAHTVSEGTLLLLGLLTVLLGPINPNVLLMDDIEQGLHPSAQKVLLEVLAEIMDTFKDLQIIATAHSPYLLDCLQPKQIRLITINDKGHARCGRLTDHPEYEKWRDEMAPGEMWSLFGENWLAQEG